MSWRVTCAGASATREFDGEPPAHGVADQIDLVDTLVGVQPRQEARQVLAGGVDAAGGIDRHVLRQRDRADPERAETGLIDHLTASGFVAMM